MAMTVATMTDRQVGTSSAGRRRLAAARRFVSSIRVRVVLGYLALMTVGLVVAVLVTRQVQLAREDRKIEQEQAQEIEELRLLATDGVDPDTGEPFGGDVTRIFDIFLSRNVPDDDEGFYTIVNGDGYLYSPGSPNLFEDPRFETRWAAARAGPTAWTTTTDVADVGEVRSLAVPLRVDGDVAGVFVIANFPDDDQGEVAQVIRVITYTGLGVLVVTSALAWSLAGRVLRPVRELSRAARSITESDQSTRIPVEGHDELAELGGTFNDMVSRLEAGFDTQRRFLDDVAHELRTPITIARGHLEFLGDDPVERAETVEIVTDELDRMSRYVSDLLLLAKAERPDFLVIGPVDIGELVADVHQRARALGTRSWVLDEAPRPGIFAMPGDPDRLSQALVNLAANAVQHTDDGDEIGIGAAHRNSHVELWVRDTGAGVDASVAETIFDRFARGVNSRSRRPDGTGLGLSIVEAIARAHGGRAAVETRLGHGATFCLTIPCPASDDDASWAPPAGPVAAIAAPDARDDGAATTHIQERTP